VWAKAGHSKDSVVSVPLGDGERVEEVKRQERGGGPSLKKKAPLFFLTLHPFFSSPRYSSGRSGGVPKPNK
jgi:hypothetical protein